MNEEELFHEALAKPTAERAAFLEQACSGNASLRAAVEALLAAHEAPGSFLNPQKAKSLEGNLNATMDSDAVGKGQAAATGEHISSSDRAMPARGSQTVTADLRRDTGPGVVIGGRYALQEKIGEGGMGEVWVAKQTEPVKRKVALKLIKTGMDSRAVLQRFEQERQALALMDHPNIARVLDGGMTPTGQPFFVMELVNGLPLTKFCDEMKLSLKERLELFVPICQAVQHAHQKGIVHRDLKPANILVTMIDGKPVPKVIDFGVAKATSGKLTEETMSTGFGAVVGTLEYMSPEQAGFSGEDIDTRADIYSLGVILYELLTGLRPIDSKRLKEAALTEMIRIIREEDPSKPSTRLSTDESLPSLAAIRQIEPKKLTALLRGELDWVVMKCLEKQRERRYETANGLARDIQRYLADEAVEARPPSAGYRMQKFVKRNRGQVIAASLVFLALVGGGVGTGIGMVLARRANADLADTIMELADKNAELAEKNTALDAERAKVENRFEMARKSIATFHTVITSENELEKEAFRPLRKKLLTEAARFYQELETLLAAETDVKSRTALADGLGQLASLTQSIGDKTQALTVFQRELAVRRELAAIPGADLQTRLALAKSLQSHSGALVETGDFAAALRAREEARDLVNALEAESPTTEVRRELANCYFRIGQNYSYWGKPQDALPNYEKARDLAQTLAAAAPGDTYHQSILALTYHGIGNCVSNAGKYEEAMAAYEQSLELREKLVVADPANRLYQVNLGHIHLTIGALFGIMGKNPESIASYEKAREVYQKLIDANPAVTHYQAALGLSISNLTGAYIAAGKYDEALAACDNAIARLQKLLDDDPKNMEVARHLGYLYNSRVTPRIKLGQVKEAVADERKAVEWWGLLPARDWSLRMQYAHALARLAKHGEDPQSDVTAAEAKTFADKCVTELAEAVKAGWTAFADLSSPNFDAIRDHEDFKKFLADLEAKLGQSANISGQLELSRYNNDLGRRHSRQKRSAEALTALDAGLTIRQKLFEANTQNTSYAQVLGYSYAYRGAARVRAGQPAEAAADLRRVLELWAKLPNLGSQEHVERSRSLALLAGLGGDASSGVSQDEAKAFADQSIAPLADAIKAGWTDLAELKEPDFDAIRERADFQKLQAELEAKLPKPAETTSSPPEKQ
ncbi:MAG: protein kinase domain-containing protein [Pirellula sp.]